MKKNNRGFLLAESLVVSTFVLTVLILLYIQFNNLTTNYKNSYNYNNVESIYDLSSVSNYLLNNNYNLSNQLTASKPYVIVYKNGSCNMDAGIIDTFCDNLINKMDAKTVIYTSSDISVIQKYVSEKDDSNINQKLREFISRVETNTVQNKGRLFAEFNNGTFATIAMDNEAAIEEPETSNVIQSWSSTSKSDFHSDKYKSSIITATFVDTRNVPSNATESWDVSKAKDGGVMAWVIPTSTDNTKYDLYIGADGGVVANTNSAYLFSKFSNLKAINNFNNFDTSNVTNMNFMFMDCQNLIDLDLSSFNTSNVTSLWQTFANCSSIIKINLNNWNTNKVTNMASMFSNCKKLTNIDVSNFNTDNVTNMSSMFLNCSSLTHLNLGNFNTGKVTEMSQMFLGCSKLSNLDLKNFNVSNVTNMYEMFHNCSGLTNLDLSGWNTKNLINMSMMFQNCSNLTSLNLSSFNTSNVTTMYQLFVGCSKLTSLDLRNFDTRKVTTMERMFSSTSALKVIYVGSHWTTNNVIIIDMFRGSGVSSVTKV